MKRILIALIVLLAAVVAVIAFYLSRQWNRTTYFENTIINGFNVSDLTPEQVLPTLKQSYAAGKIHVTENGTEQAVWTLEQLGYTVDETKLLAALEDALSRQKSSVAVLLDGLMNGNEFTITIPFNYDSGVLQQTVVSSSFATARVENVDAVLVYDAETKNYSITPEVQGTLVNDADVQNLVKATVDGMIDSQQTQNDASVQITSDMYIQPSVLSTDETLNNQMNAYNSYDKAVITHVFGSETVTIDWDTIRDWVFIENGQGMLSEEKIRDYVTSMAARYNTWHYERTFYTSTGTTVTFPESNNEYGYLVDEEGEYQQLVADIQSNTTVEREPVYSQSGIGREGTDDLAAGYVEVSLTAQHLWFYKNGELIVESDIVSGCVSKKQETQWGVFPIAYKESPATLIPSNETNGTAVQYWMPFYDGQGLHDASWRTAFGGNIYQTSGSHGCVNLPPAVAQTIFEYADTGTPVILYK